eukprot:s3236_g5.t1
MSTADGAVNGPAEAAGSLPASQLPWQQIPVFDPATTDLQVYSRKLQFLKDIWPVEYVAQLAPRAALQVQGTAFQKVSRLDPGKLRSEAGVKYLVEALGGQWGKLASEEKLSYFERAFYLTAQKPDESNDSYLARHDLAFEELTSAGVTLEEVRAYVLIRQSQLSTEDRKRIVVETEGNLSYSGARKSLRLLGSRFFHELQGGAKTNKYRTYDVNAAEVMEENAMMAAEPEPYDEESMVQLLNEAGDEDAAFILDFEETMIETIQDSPELASCYHSYMEARTRLRERAKFRGFWGTSVPAKGKGKKGKSPMGKGSSSFKPKSLAERIATSTCRRCGAVGHWKRECPLGGGGGKGETKGKPGASETITLAEALMTENATEEIYEVDEMPMDLPENATELGQSIRIPNAMESAIFGEVFNQNCLSPKSCQSTSMTNAGTSTLFKGSVQSLMGQGFVFQTSVENKLKSSFSQRMHAKLSQCCRKHGKAQFVGQSAVTFTPERPDPSNLLQSPSSDMSAGVFLSSEESAGEAVVDTGASRSVIGEDRLAGLIKYVSERTDWPIKKVASNVQFRFGNSGTLQSRYAMT